MLARKGSKAKRQSQMIDPEINSLKDLKRLRSAPSLDKEQSKNLLRELCSYMTLADWFTIGIMAPSSQLALFALKELEVHFNWSAMKVVEKPIADGPVFLKANQKTGDILVRLEYGLGEGILLSCQNDETQENVDTYGPFPLDFFKIKD